MSYDGSKCGALLEASLIKGLSPQNQSQAQHQLQGWYKWDGTMVCPGHGTGRCQCCSPHRGSSDDVLKERSGASLGSPLLFSIRWECQALDHKLNRSGRDAAAAKKANRMLGSSTRAPPSEIKMSSSSSALYLSGLACCIQFWSPLYKALVFHDSMNLGVLRPSEAPNQACFSQNQQ